MDIRKISKRLLAVILSLLVVLSSMSMGAEARTVRRYRGTRTSRVRTITRTRKKTIIRRKKVTKRTRRTIRRTRRTYRRSR
ncbi:MAG: hypothetical protein IJS99_05305 [Synergistaceae bacterium]|nr:hypothetical protein [Synergistaceae bacterium]